MSISRSPTTARRKSRDQEPMARIGTCHDTVHVTSKPCLRQWVIYEPRHRKLWAESEFRQKRNSSWTEKHPRSHMPRFAQSKKPTALPYSRTNYISSNSLCFTATRLCLINFVSDTVIGPILLRENLVEPDWLPSICSGNCPWLEKKPMKRSK